MKRFLSAAAFLVLLAGCVSASRQKTEFLEPPTEEVLLASLPETVILSLLSAKSVRVNFNADIEITR